MSAYLVTDKHISTMLAVQMETYDNKYYFNGEWKPLNDWQRVGQILIDENYRSLAARYNESSNPHRYEHTHFFKKPTQAQIFKACDDYVYQACEAGDFCETESYAIVQAIRAKAWRSLPGYEDSCWTID
jgi:hypothetical protein